jgi:transcriptional regulator with XRE-family HTH domain
MQLAALRKASGLSQKELAEQVGTSQQQISRLESTSYEGHSLSMIRRVAEVLGATVRVEIEKNKHLEKPAVAEVTEKYNTKQPLSGKVAARKCPRCGHHEVGITTDTEDFIALKPGMEIKLNGE